MLAMSLAQGSGNAGCELGDQIDDLHGVLSWVNRCASAGGQISVPTRDNEKWISVERPIGWGFAAIERRLIGAHLGMLQLRHQAWISLGCGPGAGLLRGFVIGQQARVDVSAWLNMIGRGTFENWKMSSNVQSLWPKTIL